MSPIPDNIDAILSGPQKQTIARLEDQGWTLEFVRRIGLAKPVVVLSDASGEIFGVLDETGGLDEKPRLKVRKRPGDEQQAAGENEGPVVAAGDASGASAPTDRPPSTVVRTELRLLDLELPGDEVSVAEH